MGNFRCIGGRLGRTALWYRGNRGQRQRVRGEVSLCPDHDSGIYFLYLYGFAGLNPAERKNVVLLFLLFIAAAAFGLA